MNVKDLVANYYRWLEETTVVESSSHSDWVLIDTPFLGAFNDSIEIYVQKSPNGTIELSDDGETMRNLELQGVSLTGSQKRKALLEAVLNTYGVSVKDKELRSTAKVETFSVKKHNFLQAILEINDLYVISKPNVTSVFKEYVSEYLMKEEVIFTPDFISRGVSGLEFAFDFQIAHKSTEIVLKSFSSINKSNLTSFLFSWEDIKPVREKATKKTVEAIAIINDAEKKVSAEYLEALEQKDAKYILWSERLNLENKLKLAA